jgi:hypothetical protein
VLVRSPWFQIYHFLPPQYDGSHLPQRKIPRLPQGRGQAEEQRARCRFGYLTIKFMLSIFKIQMTKTEFTTRDIRGDLNLVF